MELLHSVRFSSLDPYCFDNFEIRSLSHLTDPELLERYLSEFEYSLDAGHEIELCSIHNVGFECFAVCETLVDLKDGLNRLVELFEQGVYDFQIELVNLTPHCINVENDYTSFSIEPSGIIARVNVNYVDVGAINGVTRFEREFGEVNGVPEPIYNTVYIVSSMVSQALPDRGDVVAPNTAVAVRDLNGNIVSVPSFVK